MIICPVIESSPDFIGTSVRVTNNNLKRMLKSQLAFQAMLIMFGEVSLMGLVKEGSFFPIVRKLTLF